MRILSAAGLICLASGAQAGALYRCAAKDFIRLQDDGTLGAQNRERWIEATGTFFVDTDAGTLRRSSGKLETWTVVQEESGANDFVASPWPSRASAATDFIRVRAWAGRPIVTFMWFALSQMVSGTCERAR